MMTDDRAELRRLAEAATPGARTVEHDGNEQACLCTDTGETLIAVFPHQCVESIRLLREADAAYIAAADPATVLGLLDEVERLRHLVDSAAEYDFVPMHHAGKVPVTYHDAGRLDPLPYDWKDE